MDYNHIVIDIETIPDEELIENSICKIMNFRDFNEYKEFESQFVKPGKTWFPKIIFHKPVCIGILFISPSLHIKYIDFCNLSDDSEIVNNFWEIFHKSNNPVIVSYAGKTFDMCVLENRGLKYIDSFNENAIKGLLDYRNISDTWEKYRPNYKNYKTAFHIDLIEQFGRPQASLKEACTLYDIEVKNYGDNRKIKEMSEDEIRIYCFEDIISTAMLWYKTNLLYATTYDDYITNKKLDFYKQLVDYKNEYIAQNK